MVKAGGAGSRFREGTYQPRLSNRRRICCLRRVDELRKARRVTCEVLAVKDNGLGGQAAPTVGFTTFIRRSDPPATAPSSAQTASVLAKSSMPS